MKAFCFSVAVLLASLSESVRAEKLTLAHVAINPGQGMFEETRESLKPLPYPDDEGLRAELEQINAPKLPGPEHYVNVSFLDELKKNGLVDKLYR